MNDVAPQPAGQGANAAAQQAWLQATLGIDVASFQGNAAAPGGGPGGPGGGSDKALDATDTDLFFDKDSATLTAKDQQALDKYAAAYLAAKSNAPIAVDGYASTEGEKGHNDDLSDKRAKAVAAYLIDHGKLSKEKVTPTPHGATDVFSKDNLAPNRRVTLKPPPASLKPQSDDPTVPHHLGDGLGHRDDDGNPLPPAGQKGPVGLPQLDDESGKKIVGTDTDAPRDLVERNLKSFLEEVAHRQKKKKVRANGRALTAEMTLRKGLDGKGYIGKDDKSEYDPDDLASKIAEKLPEKIPGKNFTDFMALKPVEEDAHGSLTEETHKKYVEARDKLVKKLPKWAQDKARDLIDAGVEKGESFVLGKGLDALDPPLKDEIQKFVDEWTKKAVDGSDDKSK